MEKKITTVALPIMGIITLIVGAMLILHSHNQEAITHNTRIICNNREEVMTVLKRIEPLLTAIETNQSWLMMRLQKDVINTPADVREAMRE